MSSSCKQLPFKRKFNLTSSFLTGSSLPKIRMSLARLSAHIVVALLALVVIGGATRVMEAGLACPDWPLCYGSFFPGGKMNLQVFLEWFHRLDAFLVGIALLIQFCIAIVNRTKLPKWLPWVYGLMLFFILIQGMLGALTVSHLLPSFVVSAHLILAFTLLSIMSGITQVLLRPDSLSPPIWWKPLCGFSLIALIGQSLVGGLMATSWSGQRCLSSGEACQLFDLHRTLSLLPSFLILTFVVVSFVAGGWARSQWPFLMTVSLMLSLQVSLGIMTVNSYLNMPVLRIAHQLIAALLVALLASLFSRGPTAMSKSGINSEGSFTEVCLG